jgi:hypothetical protein
MGHATTQPKLDEKLHLDTLAPKLLAGGLVIGVAGLAGAFVLGYMPEAQRGHFYHAYLMSFCFYLAIALGALFFVLIQHLTRAGWSVVVRRLAEGISATLPLLALLALPIVIPVLTHTDHLYHWTHAHVVAEDKILLGKSAYLNPTFFGIRVAVYFVVWCGIALYYRGLSIRQDHTGSNQLTMRMQSLSPLAMILFAITLTLAAVDFLMSLNPHWFSTMWGVYYFSTCVLAGVSVLILLSVWLQKTGRLATSITLEHYHDLGKLVFAFTVFWAYIAFSQYMLIWYANLPEETSWYYPRQLGPWGWVSLALVVLHLLVPFVGMISRAVKRKRGLLTIWAIWTLLVCLLDLFWIVIPQHWIGQALELTDSKYVSSFAKSADDIYALSNPKIYELLSEPFHATPMLILGLCLVGMGGLFVATLALMLKSAALRPVQDPRLDESLAFENY